MPLNSVGKKFSSVAQSCPTLCKPMNHSTPGLPVHQHLLEFAQFMTTASVMPCSHLTSSFNPSRCMKVKVKSLSRVQLFATPWTVAHQAPLSMEFSRQEYWSGVPFSSPGDLPNPGIEPRSPTLQADALPSEPPGKPQELPIPTIN